jgi:hypothetical protein
MLNTREKAAWTIIHMYDINEDTTCKNNWGRSRAQETSMIQTTLPLSVCTKWLCENQVHNYKLVRQGSLEHIMQGGSLKDKR